MPDHDDLTHEEREHFSRLPRESSPPRALEERVVMALRREGLLHAAEPLRLVFRPAWIAAAAAACVAIFAGGFALGGWVESRHTTDLLATLHEKDSANAAAAAAAVQRTGSAYVAALAALAAVSDTSHSSNLSQGREVAVNALHAAANELVRLAPDDPVAVRILQGMAGDEARTPGNATAGATPRRTVWY